MICGKAYVSKNFDFEENEDGKDLQRAYRNIKEISVRFTEEGEKDEVRIYVEE